MHHTTRAYGVGDAVRLGLALAPYDLCQYKEPVAPEHFAGYREVRSRVPVPIAGGEKEHTLYGFRDLLAGGARRRRAAGRAVDAPRPARAGHGSGARGLERYRV
jgi:L-alanine-DL-glutamate epimerase-like enolase superfamily enzyme